MRRVDRTVVRADGGDGKDGEQRSVPGAAGGTTSRKSTESRPGGPAGGIGRRAVLRRAGIVGLAGVGGLVALPSPPQWPEGTSNGSPSASATATSDEFPYQGATVASEDDAPIVRFQYRRDGDEYVPTAPINVVFPLNDREEGLEAVTGVLDNLGWTRRVEEYARYAWDRNRERYVHQQETAAETCFGMHGRLHVRCWAFEGVVSMQAHEDSAVRPRHGIETYAGAESAVVARYRAEGWHLAPTGVDLENERGPDHDGIASILRPEAA